MRKVAARWVPHYLTSEQAEHRLEIATDLLSRFSEEGNKFLSRIVTIDETWVRSYEPELKSQASEWHAPNSRRPAKFWRTQGKLKMLMIFAYDIHEILTSHWVLTSQTVNGKYYREYLRPAIRKKPSELLRAGPIILHDNAMPHISQGVTSLLCSYGWEKLAHPAYSPAISPCDYDLFPRFERTASWCSLQWSGGLRNRCGQPSQGIWTWLPSNRGCEPTTLLEFCHWAQGILLRRSLER